MKDLLRTADPTREDRSYLLQVAAALQRDPLRVGGHHLGGALLVLTHSLMEACALTGVDIAVATPPNLAPDPAVMVRARRLAADSGSQVDLVHDPRAADGGAAPIPIGAVA